jgi:hypothetical protein
VQAKTTAKVATLKVSSEMAALDSPSGLGMVKKTFASAHGAPQSGFLSVRRRAGYGECSVSVGWLTLGQANNPLFGQSGDLLSVSRLDLDIKPGLRDEPIVV